MFAGSLHQRSGSYRFCWILGLVLTIVGGLAQGTRTRTKQPSLSTISMPTLKEIIDRASKVVSRRVNTLEPEIYNSGTVLAPNSPAWFVAASAKTKIAAKNVSRLALLVEETTKMLKQRFFLSKDQIGKELLTVDVRGTALERHCPSSVDFPCQPRKYRAYSGYCNNVQHPNWGNANTPYVRYLSPDYVDGVNIPRQSAAGGVLPDARLVSRTVHSRPERTHHPYLTVLMAVFADFVLHDIYHISQTAGYRGHRIRCCGVPSHLLHPECYIIKNSSSSSSSDCMEYVRSSNAPRAGCTLGPREQINQATSFLDGSTIYGSSSEENRNLRAFKGGQMKMQNVSHNLHLLPPDVANMYDCKVSPITNHHCFLAGDVRVNENAGLMAMHTIWVREHNRIAQKLSSFNPHWNDEQVFEETRRIVVAQLQHITYSELLPALLGVQVTRQFDLEPLSADEGFYTEYYIDVNPGTSNAVATAVAASFYSMLPSRFHLYAQELKKDGIAKPSAEAPKLKRVGSALASDTFFAPGPFYKGETLDKLIIGMANQRADAMDPFLASNTVSDHPKQPDLDSHVFNISIDKVALIIQQGRDHGLPGYISWRRICRLQPNITNFTDLSKVMPREAARRISSVYKDLRDVDLFTGGVSENPLVGGVVGPTFACLLSRQFQHLRRGDRHWYENDLPPATFTQDQLREIKKVSFARIICDNADIMTFIQPSVMLMPDSYLNALQTCETASPVVDLIKWKTNSPATDLPSSAILNSLKMAQKEIEARMAAEREIFNKNVGVAESRSPQAMHHVFLRPKRQSNIISNLSLILEMASLDYMHHVHQRDAERKLSDDEIASTMRALSSQNVIEYLEEAMSVPQDVFNPRESVRLCHEENSYPCDHTSPFRTISGWCNNLENPGWGKSFITVRRLMPPYYEDGISSPRNYGKSGDPLPSPRLVSTSVHYDTQAPHARYSLALMQWGQFLDHDLTLTPMYDAPGGRPLDCKSCDSTSTIHPECWPIVIPEKDPFFPSTTRQNGSKCISFARSLAGQLTLGQREQLDQVTSFLDASNIYGSDPCESRMLRISHGGRLNITRHPSGRGKDLLPQDISNVECRAPSGICFESGDIRASEQPGLTSMHTIWMREHNSIADQLSSINSHWDDELLYQHSRRIISAMMQSITYTEFLPRVLGESLWKQRDLAPSSDEDKIYDSRCDPTILNEFATAAYRFGHTLLKPALPRMKDMADLKSEKQKSIRLRHAFFNPDVLYEQGAIDEVLRGLLSTSVEVFDHSITSEVTNHLFENSKKPFSGMDLVSLNLQRGRDHGIPPYNEYRALCNRSRAEKFEDLIEDMPDHIIRRLLKVYKHVDDIDLFTGGISEKSMYGALVGPTFGCIIATQFQLLKKCDRFWYESKDPYIRFTKNQISEIRQRRLSKVICDNSDSINMVQMSAMDLPDDFRNPRMPCSSLTPLDLSYWTENPNCHMPISDQSPKDKSDGFIVPLGQSAPMSPCVSCACTKEGLICQSLKVTNCFKLASEFSPKLVLADDVCKVQCAFAFRTYPKFENPILLSNQLGFSSS